MRYTGSIKKRLIFIILLITVLTSIVGYSSFVYWSLSDHQKSTIKLSKTVGLVLSQNIAQLVLLNKVSAAADISSQLKAFNSLDNMVLYKLDGKVLLQYSRNNQTFDVEPLTKSKDKFIFTDNILKSFINAKYQDTHLGYIQLNFKINSMWDIFIQNIMILVFILSFMFMLSFLLAIYFAKQFTQPIVKLVSFLEDIKLLDSLDKKIITNENNEYGKLYKEVNTMLQRIKTNQESLKIAAVAFETQNGMTITDKDNKILQINKAFTDITGYTASEAIGQTPAVLKSGIQGDEFYKEMYQSLEKYNYWGGEIDNRHKDGNIVKEYLTINSVLDDKGDTIYYVASFSDITLQKETEEKLKQKEIILVQQSKMALMGEMLENIAHQWRQPLSLITTISSGMQVIKEHDLGSTKEEDIKNFTSIIDASQYLSQTIDDFKNFFNPKKQKVVFNLKDTYAKTFNIISSKFTILNIEICKNIDDIELNNLENELMQVIMNILNNARDELETKDQKRIILVDIYEENKNAVIKITDNAGGVPQNIINRIFDSYFTTKENKDGTGIGLHMSKEIIEKHIDGTLEVENTTYNHESIEYTGACFTITIPIK